jgi:undecaprenyl-diphosphatase
VESEKMKPSKHPNPKTLLTISLVSIACLLAITFSRSIFTDLNLAVNSWAASINTSSFTGAATIISECFDTLVLLAASLPIAGLLLYRHHARDGALLFGAMSLDAVLLWVFKTCIDSPRPLNGLIIEQSNSFPSGHLTSTIVLVGMLAYFAWQTFKSQKVKLLSTLTAVALASLVCFDRIYLNVHWFSDVVAAPFLAMFVLSASILGFSYLLCWLRRMQWSVSQEVLA